MYQITNQTEKELYKLYADVYEKHEDEQGDRYIQ